MTWVAEPGATLSRYRLVEKLGQGGMGVVFRAYDCELERDVALKLLPPELVAGDRDRAHLLREARTASKLNHPNLCTIHEVGKDQGQVYIAMELVEGQPMTTLIPAGGLPNETVVRYAAPVARALAHAHARGVLHRDVKTANIVVGPESRPILLDFGLASSLASDSTVNTAADTTTGVISGTPQYLAPELLQGGRPSVASDLWALGVVLYEMCSGTKPFVAPHVAGVVTAILTATPASLPAHTSSGLCAVVARCLTKNPSQRYASANELAAALEALVADSSGTSRNVRPPERGARMWVGGLGVLGLAAVALFATDAGGLRKRVFAAGSSGGVHSIAVLPLENRPPDPAQEYFCDGMTEQLIGELAQLRGLRVISRTSIMRFKGTQQPLSQIAKTLGVDAVVEGSVQQDSSIVRINARLVDARTDQQLWAGSFDRPRRNVLALQSEIAQVVTEQIRTRLSGSERARLARSDEVDPAAFDHYLRGRYALARHSAKPALEEFREAIAIDPRYARAYAGLAHGYVLAHATGDSAADRVREPALRAGMRAVELDAESAEAWLGLANVRARLAWDLAGAEHAASEARRLSPGDAEAHHTYGLVAGALGRLKECVRELRQARTLDPLSLYYQQQLGEVFVYSRRYDEAIVELTKTLEMSPDFSPARHDLGWAYLEKGDPQRAIAELERVPSPDAMLACAYARVGRTTDARKLLAQLEKPSGRASINASGIAQVYAALGDKASAFQWLERSYARREQGFLTIPFEPELDRLRSDPRYAALVARLPSAQGRAREAQD